MSHRHRAATRADERSLDLRLGLTAGLNVAITVAEFLGGLLSGSLALLSDSAHNLGDAVTVVLALWARRVSRRPPTLRHTYGFKRAEVIAALSNAVLLLAATVLIAREAVVRLLHPEPVARGIMLVVGSAALLANAGSVLLLRRHEASDVNARSAFLHLAQDALERDVRAVGDLLARIKARLRDQWGITHATLEPELESCGQSELLGRWDDAEPPPSKP